MKKTLALILMLAMLATSAVALAAQIDQVNGDTISYGNFGIYGFYYALYNGDTAKVEAKLAQLFGSNNMGAGESSVVRAAPAVKEPVNPLCKCVKEGVCLLKDCECGCSRGGGSIIVIE